MSGGYRDPDDDWGRLAQRLRERRAELTEGIIGGDLGQRQYDAECGRIAEIDEFTKLIRMIRRGEDLKPPTQPAEPAISAEDR